MPILASRSSHGLRSSEETPDSLELLCKQPATEVFFDEGTGEIFADYEKYLEHFALKSRPLWMCRYTGKSGLTYSEALDSETQSEAILESFPESWKYFIFSLIQHCTKVRIKSVHSCSVRLSRNDRLQSSRVWKISLYDWRTC